MKKNFLLKLIEVNPSVFLHFNFEIKNNLKFIKKAIKKSCFITRYFKEDTLNIIKSDD